ncbi:right-handed parallel beta-helix repeat-containing protein [Azospirillum sp. B4]|uniref:right-handed parallel beta-helix repeat-containing protein n=1 Tax=Azospirillum sp. B4 TaxID=95605 RepID=UPI000349C848|nr:right-handed parallel beta-helix repeat-containing protein [Azospirillum sp. B4]
MAQYRTGTVTLATGSATVTGAGTAWPANVKVGDLLWLGYGIPMGRVAAVNSDTELTLEAAWAGQNYAGASYSIIRDFEPKTGAPLLAHGDPGANDVFNRAITTVAGAMQGRTIDNISPLDYGAVPDGETDSGASLALALAAAAGGTLTIRGAYVSDQALTVPAHTTVTGDGSVTFTAGGLTLEAGAIWDGPSVTAATGNAVTVAGDDVTLADGAVHALAGTCIVASGRARLTLRNLLLADAAGAGLAVDHIAGLDIDGCTIDRCAAHGIAIRSGCSDISIHRTRIKASGALAGDGAGIKFVGWYGDAHEPNTRIRITNCDIEYSGHLALELWGGADDVTISGVTVTGSGVAGATGFGISLDTVTRATVTGCVINGGTTGFWLGLEMASCSGVSVSAISVIGASTGLSITGPSTPASDITVAGLIVSGASGNAVGFFGATRVDISDLKVLASTGPCFHVQNAVEVTLRGARLETSSTAQGAYISSDASVVTVDGVTLHMSGASAPDFAIHAANTPGAIILGRILAENFTIATQGVSGADIRTIDGDSYNAGYGAAFPLSQTSTGASPSMHLSGVAGARRTLFDTAGTRIIRFKLRKTSGGQGQITHVITWSSRQDNTPLGGIITVAFGSYGALDTWPAVGAIGVPPTWTGTTLDTDGYPIWDIILPGNANMSACIDSSGPGVVFDDWLIYRVADAASTAGRNQVTAWVSGAPVNHITGSGDTAVLNVGPWIGGANLYGGINVLGATSGAVQLLAPTVASGVLTLPNGNDTLLGAAKMAVANGLATLDSTGKLLTNQLPALSITDTWTVASQAAMLALTAQRGDVAVRSDSSQAYILAADDPAVLANWVQLPHPAAPVLSVFGRTGAVAAAAGDYTAAMITNTATGGLASVTVQAALNELDTKKAPLASPALTGTPTAPTATAGTNTTQLATTAFVTAAVGAEITRAQGAEALLAPLASPTFNGTPAAPTAAADTNTTQVATTAYVVGQAGTATPAMNGTASAGSSTRYARADHVHPTDTSRAALASPTFTGTPAAPTAAADTNTTQLATTAFVIGQLSASAPVMNGTAAAGSSTRAARADHVHPTDTSRAPLASPAFTGAPTVTPTSNDTGLVVKTVGGTYDGVYLGTNASRGSLTVYNSGVSAFNVNGASGNVTAGGSLTTAGTVLSQFNPTATSAHVTAYPASGTLAQEGKVRLGGTFYSSSDTGVRLVGSIRTGFSASGWGNEYMDFYLNSTINDTASDANMSRVLRLGYGNTASFSGAVTVAGTLTAPTAAVDTNTTQVATTAFVLAQAGTATPGMDGTAAVGSSTRYARADHVHPTDSSRAPLASPTFTGTVTTAALTATGLLRGYLGVAGGNQNFAVLTPTDYAVGKPQLFFKTDSVTTNWRIGLWDGASNAGTLYLDAGTVAVSGVLTASTAAVDTNTTQVATTAFVLAQASAATPAMDGTAAVGTSNRYARADHVHPTDTSRAPTASPTFSGTVTSGGAIAVNGGGRVNSPSGTSPSISGVAPAFSVNEGSGVAFSLVRTTADTSGVNFVLQKTRGTSYNSVATVNSGDGLGYLVFAGADGSNILPTAQISAVVDAAPSTGSVPTRLDFATGSSGRGTTRMSIASSGAVTVNGVTAFDASGIIGLRSYTVATLPSASPGGRVVYVSDGTSNKRQAVSDGTNWRWPDGAVVS